MGNTAEVRVGRLIEVSARGGYSTAQDVHAIFYAVGAAAASIKHASKVVLVVDWRQCPLMSPDASTLFVDSLRKSNDRVERSAALASGSSPTTMLQFWRVIKQSDNLNRRLFDNISELTEWLDEVLEPAEQARLRQFLR